MIRTSRRAIGAAIAVAILAALIVVTRGPAKSYESLTGGAANLRAQFNADAGTVRMVILPAPT